MSGPEPFANLIALLYMTDKRELAKHCRQLVVHSDTFAELVMGGRAGLIPLYRYACHFAQHSPGHLRPTDEEFAALGGSKVGSPLEGKAKKLITKIAQTFEERRLFAAHLFYAPTHERWHLFYFDQRDQDEAQNHWKHGAHIHYLSSVCLKLPLPSVWERVQAAKLGFSKSFHLRYKDTREANAA